MNHEAIVCDRSPVEQNGMAFEYAPLDPSKPYIRLIKFLPRSQSGLLRFELQNNVSLQAQRGKRPATRFNALSYEWGDTDLNNIIIIINDRCLYIRENLHSFLQALYEHHQGQSIGWIWADAICIDQKNLKERNHQVQQMKAIYSSANVLAWLRPRSCRTMPLVCQLSKHFNSQSSPDDFDADGHISTNDVCDTDEIYDTTQIFRERETLKDAIIDFYSCSYWNRLWVMQELVLPSEVMIHCDQYRIDLKSLVNLFRIRYLDQILDVAVALNRCHWHKLHAYLYEQGVQPGPRWQTHRILDCLRYFGNAICSVPHDKIYGLLGIVTPGESAIEVDYRKTIEEVFIDCLSQCRNMDDLHQLTEKLNFVVTFDDNKCFFLTYRPDGAPSGIFPLGPLFEVGEHPGLGLLVSPHCLDDDLGYSGHFMQMRDSILDEPLRDSFLALRCTSEREIFTEHDKRPVLYCHCSLCTARWASTPDHTLPRIIDLTEADIELLMHRGDSGLLSDAQTFYYWSIYFTKDREYLATQIVGGNNYDIRGGSLLYRDPFHTEYQITFDPGSLLGEHWNFGQYQGEILYSMRSAFYALAHMFPADPSSLISGLSTDPA